MNECKKSTSDHQETFMNIAVFASGGGSNFQALIDRRESGDLHVNISVLIGNNSTARAFERARLHGIDTVHCTSTQFSTPQQYTQALHNELQSRSIDLIVLAGYMKMIPHEIIACYRNRVVNIHPALLPAFGGKGMYGMRVHQAVIAYGVKVSGITIHFVDENYDNGPIIFQKAVDVEEDDTQESLAARILTIEHECYWRVIQAIAQGKIVVNGRQVKGMR